jgi:hypothetical protein
MIPLFRCGDQSAFCGYSPKPRVGFDSHSPLTILAHACVASLRVGRRINGNGAVCYFDLI